VRRDQGERIVRIHLDINLGKAAAHTEAASAQQEAVVGVRVAGGRRELPQDRDVDKPAWNGSNSAGRAGGPGDFTCPQPRTSP
jgi:hypothetical protein